MVRKDFNVSVYTTSLGGVVPPHTCGRRIVLLFPREMERYSQEGKAMVLSGLHMGPSNTLSINHVERTFYPIVSVKTHSRLLKLHLCEEKCLDLRHAFSKHLQRCAAKT